MKINRTGLAVATTMVIAVALIGCSGKGQSAQSRGEVALTQSVIPSVDPAHLKLTLAWNRQDYTVPPAAELPPGMVQSKAFRDWWKVGNIRTLEWTDPTGIRYVAEAWGRVREADGQIRPLIPRVWRYRADGTMENMTTNLPGGPAEWTVYAADGRTPLVHVVNRLSGIAGAPYIENVYFQRPDGTNERGYQANRYGVVYLEWFYKENGDPDHWNGSSKLNGPLAAQ